MSNKITNQSRVVFLKQCPRCRGDIHVSSDIYGDYQECLHCGYMGDVPMTNPFEGLRIDPSGMDEVA